MRRAPAAPPRRRGLLTLLLVYAVALALCLTPLPWVARSAQASTTGTTASAASRGDTSHPGVTSSTAATENPGNTPATGNPGNTLATGNTTGIIGNTTGIIGNTAAIPTATQDEGIVQVRLDSVTPSVAGPGTEVLVSGTLTNAGTEPAQVHSVRVSTAGRGLDTRAAVDEWAAQGDGETPILLAEDRIGAALTPGAVVRFFARIPADTIEPGFEFATLPLRLEVTEPVVGTTGWPADGEGSGEDVPAEPIPDTELRTFLPWQGISANQFTPIDLAWVAPLTLPGGSGLVDPDAAVREQAWSAAIGPESANLTLLAGLSGTAATFVVDPAMLEPLDPVASLTEAVQLPEDEGEAPEESPEDTPTHTPAEQTPADQTAEPPPGLAPEVTDGPPAGSTEGSTGQPSEPAATSPANGSGGNGDSEGSGDGEGAGGGASAGGGDGVNAGDGANEGGGAGEGVDSASDPSSTDPGSTDPATATGPEGPDADEDTESPTEGQEPVDPPTPPTTQAAVLALSALISQIPTEQLWWLPVGDVDTGALLGLDTETEALAALVGRSPGDSLAAPGRTDVAWPLAGQVDDAALEQLGEVWRLAGGAMGAAGLRSGSLTGVLLPTSVLEGEVHTGSAVRRHPSGTRILAYDERLAGIAASTGWDQDGRSVQRFLAETLAVYQERPALERSLVVALPRGTRVDPDTLRTLTAAARNAPWLTETSAAELLDAPAPDSATIDTATITPPPADDSVGQASPLTQERVEEIEGARAALGGASEIVPGSEEAQLTWRRVLDRQYSARWRQDDTGWSEPVDRASALAQEILSGLTINPTTINFFADEGLIQITVTNDLPVQIDNLRMTVSPGNTRLRILAQPDPITIGPESRATVQFRARAIAAGEVPLETSLSTPNGTPVGEGAETAVRVRPAGVWIYWLLGGVAGVILVLGLVRALRPRSPSSPPQQKVATTGPDPESS